MQSLIVGTSSMFFNKRTKAHDEKKEAEVQQIRQSYIKPLEDLDDRTAKIVEKLKTNWDITEAIYVAIGGAGRGKH